MCILPINRVRIVIQSTWVAVTYGIYSTNMVQCILTSANILCTVHMKYADVAGVLAILGMRVCFL